MQHLIMIWSPGICGNHLWSRTSLIVIISIARLRSQSSAVQTRTNPEFGNYDLHSHACHMTGRMGAVAASAVTCALWGRSWILRVSEILNALLTGYCIILPDWLQWQPGQVESQRQNGWRLRSAVMTYRLSITLLGDRGKPYLELHIYWLDAATKDCVRALKTSGIAV